MSGDPQRALHVHFTPRGEEHVEVETRPIRGDGGKIMYVVEILRPVRVASATSDPHGLVGRGAAFRRMLELVQRVAGSDTAVLLLGESGTGKEAVAQAIHAASGRAQAPFVPVECSGLTESLFESELFGYEKGAFTGAQQRKIGLIEAAQGGTVFLDEVGDIPLSLQVKLLRLLETRTFRRVGSVEATSADFRLICATHRDLKAMVAAGDFRQDLYYRISAFPIPIPPLRERGSDLTLLIETLLQRIAPGRRLTLDAAAMACLQRYAFPGNVRELRNILERASLLTDSDTILPEHLPEECHPERTASCQDPSPPRRGRHPGGSATALSARGSLPISGRSPHAGARAGHQRKDLVSQGQGLTGLVFSRGSKPASRDRGERSSLPRCCVDLVNGAEAAATTLVGPERTAEIGR